MKTSSLDFLNGRTAVTDVNTDTIILSVDQLIRAGLAMKPSVYVDDVKTASPEVLNQQFEEETFGHRALIHAHIQMDNQLWGILQPCMFGSPRHWTTEEKTQIEAILPRLQPVVAAYVKT